MVLDRIEDYVTHKIVPPIELQEAYYALLAQQRKEPQLTPENILESTLRTNKFLQSWYKTGNSTQTSDKDGIPPAPEIIEVVEDDMEIEETVIESTEYYLNDAPALRVSRGLSDVASAPANQEISPNKESKKAKTSGKPKIKVLAWIPDAPYMTVLRNTAEKDLDSVYFQLKKTNKTRPSFYVQVADYYFSKKTN